MPTSLLGLLLFVVLLAPGFCYVLRQEQRQPGHAVSVFRETVTLTITSILCDLTVAALVAVLRIRFPRAVPDIGQLVRDPADYARARYATLGWWSAGLLAAACLLGLLLASVDLTGTLERCSRVRWLGWLLPPVSTSVRLESHWWWLFRQYPRRRKYVTCHLDDGSYLSGWLVSYATMADETPDRELVLTRPLYHRPPDSDEEQALDYDAAAISARHIVSLLVRYMPLVRTVEAAAGDEQVLTTMLLDDAQDPNVAALGNGSPHDRTAPP
jgi:MFS family permease